MKRTGSPARHAQRLSNLTAICIPSASLVEQDIALEHDFLTESLCEESRTAGASSTFDTFLPR